jgi:hypothetical protein
MIVNINNKINKIRENWLYPALPWGGFSLGAIFITDFLIFLKKIFSDFDLYLKKFFG